MQSSPSSPPRSQPSGTVIPILPEGQAARRWRPTPKGRQVADADRQRVADLCEGLAPRADLLIEHLHRLQDGEGGLRKGRLAALAERLRLSQVEVYEVATFYHHFDMVEDDATLPAVTVRVCTSLPCQMAGGQDLLRSVQDRLGDAVRVVEAPCIGQCHQAPAACVGQHQLPQASADAVQDLLAKGETAPRALPSLGVPVHPGDHTQLRRLLAGELSADAVLAELKASGLRGLGGAGFPAWRKWETVRAQPGPRHMVVNL